MSWSATSLLPALKHLLPSTPPVALLSNLTSTLSSNLSSHADLNSVGLLDYRAHLADLSPAEVAWASYYARVGDPILATALLVFCWHEIVYFGRSLPYIIIDSFSLFKQYKLQPGKVATTAEQWKVAKHMLWCHFTIELPLIAGFHPFCAFLGLATFHVPFPPWQTVLWQLAVFFVVEDTVHYFSHRLLHTPYFYKWIHKVHHEYPAPFGLTAEYAHPLEVLILGSGTIGGPVVLCALTGNLHLLTMLIWITLRLCQAVSAHSGYDFPFSLRHWLPFWAGAEHHDYHHMAFINNFSSSFRHWDRLLGTDTKYHAYRARIDSAKTQAARERVRKVEDEKAEAEGVVLANETIARAT